MYDKVTSLFDVRSQLLHYFFESVLVKAENVVKQFKFVQLLLLEELLDSLFFLRYRSGHICDELFDNYSHHFWLSRGL